MLPEPNPVTPRTRPKRPAAPARPQRGIMTPLFSVPGGTEPEVAPAAGRRARSSGTLKDPADLLAVTAERLRRALARSYLRYGLATDLEAAVHAAMNVIEPVLEARDSEILRLRRLMAGQAPVPASARRSPASKVSRKA
jgi:hypothetical protein